MTTKELALRIALSTLLLEFAVLSRMFCKDPDLSKAYREGQGLLSK